MCIVHKTSKKPSLPQDIGGSQQKNTWGFNVYTVFRGKKAYGAPVNMGVTVLSSIHCCEYWPLIKAHHLSYPAEFYMFPADLFLKGKPRKKTIITLLAWQYLLNRCKKSPKSLLENVTLHWQGKKRNAIMEIFFNHFLCCPAGEPDRPN